MMAALALTLLSATVVQAEYTVHTERMSQADAASTCADEVRGLKQRSSSLQPLTRTTPLPPRCCLLFLSWVVLFFFKLARLEGV
jgi:hypothetical protein